MNLVAADVRRLIPFPASEVRASSRRLLRLIVSSPLLGRRPLTNAFRHGLTLLLFAHLAAMTARADVILDWTELMLDAIRADNTGPTLSTRNLAILHTAIYDAVNSIERTHQPYRFFPAPPADASTESAAVAAAYEVMRSLYPPLQARAEDLYVTYVVTAAATPALTNGLAFGAGIGRQVVESRSADGSSTTVPYIPSNAPGQWRRTPPFFRPPLDPHWRYVELFCLPDIEPFVPPGPPALTSQAYALDYNQVKEIGAKNSPTRTVEQSEIAVFWSDFSYTAMPPGHWHEVAMVIARNRANTLSQNARMLALISLAQADAAIVCWETKYRFNFWRPVTAIQRGDEDGNPATEKDETWNHFLAAPPFPEYSSGHSTFSKATADVLAHFYGTDAISFTVGSDSLPGVYRSFQSLAECADEVGMSRVYGGIHFMSANRDGKASGAKIGNYVAGNYLIPNERLPRLLVERGGGESVQLRVHGHMGKQCVVESSPDLARWTPISTNSPLPGGFVLSRTITPEQRREFYRVREP